MTRNDVCFESLGLVDQSPGECSDRVAVVRFAAAPTEICFDGGSMSPNAGNLLVQFVAGTSDGSVRMDDCLGGSPALSRRSARVAAAIVSPEQDRSADAHRQREKQYSQLPAAS